LYPKALRVLAEEVLGIIIQGGEHDSVRTELIFTPIENNQQFTLG
jgi:hypothetical protein